ncbi:MAG: DegT/DnrJ/EryC1/StrS family aminotransferase [Desulfobacteraceae bacterium]|nr:MAG: DegT/DnrJ/EryC1/StrS family aminotransferase [Desulfobacteraceae bacterium]
MKVPFIDLKSQYDSIREEVNGAIQQVLDACAFAGGPFTEEFEKNFARFCGSRHCIGVGSGTDALWISLLALGVGAGDEVITVPSTFIATAEAISFSGATPVFIDIDEKTYTMDPQKLEDYLKARGTKPNRPKAVIPVHLFGQTADMDPILEIAKRYGLFVIEDACQSHGALYRGRPAGSMGDTGCFSFYPGKNLGAYGEAGAVVTDNSEVAETIRKFRDHGQSKKYFHSMIGWNSRMDGLQGAVLNVKLKHLPRWNRDREANAGLYNRLLSEIDGVVEPVKAEYARHIYHIYAIRVQERDRFIRALEEKDIHCGIHYPVPVHLQEAYRSNGIRKSACPVAEKCATEFVSLPMYPELKTDQIEYVASEIRRYCEAKALSSGIIRKAS